MILLFARLTEISGVLTPLGRSHYWVVTIKLSPRYFYLSIILHFVQILLSTFDPASRFSFLVIEKKTSLRPAQLKNKKQFLFFFTLCPHQDSNATRSVQVVAISFVNSEIAGNLFESRKQHKSSLYWWGQVAKYN